MSLSHIVQSYRSQLVTQAATVEHTIQAAHSHMLASVQPHLEALYKLLRAAYESGQKLALHWLYISNRLQAIKHIVSQSVAQFASSAQSQSIGLQHAAIALGGKAALAQLNSIDPSQTFDIPQDRAAKIDMGPFNTLGSEAADRVGKALIAGVSIGQHPETIARTISTALLTSLHRSLTIARTSQAQTYRKAVLVTAQANDNTVKGWEWEALPSACPFCLSMDGSQWPLAQDMDSHPNCYCGMKLITTEPVTA